MHEVSSTTSPAEFKVELPGPLDVPGSLELFKSSGDDLIDRWDGANLVRTIGAGKGAVAYACESTGTVEEPALRVRVERAVRSTLVPAPPEFGDLLRVETR